MKTIRVLPGVVSPLRRAAWALFHPEWRPTQHERDELSSIVNGIANLVESAPLDAEPEQGATTRDSIKELYRNVGTVLDVAMRSNNRDADYQQMLAMLAQWRGKLCEAFTLPEPEPEQSCERCGLNPASICTGCHQFAEPEQGWQDISTAPKDGRWLLLYSCEHRRYWFGTGYYFKGVPGDGEGWVAHSFHTLPTNDSGGCFSPSHWRPMLVPPRPSSPTADLRIPHRAGPGRDDDQRQEDPVVRGKATP